jgi:hypothetical protein
MNDPSDGLVRGARDWLATGACKALIAGQFDAQAKTSPGSATLYPRPLRPSAAEHWLPGIH